MSIILDIETIGFPDRKGMKYGETLDYRDNSVFDTARIVQFTIMICNENLETINLEDLIIKTDGFKIPNSHIHGITEQISIDKGVILKDTFEVFHNYLKQCSHIIAHNTDFDIPIIKNELYRLGMLDIIKELDSKIIFCTMKNTKNIVNIKNNYGVKYPSLKELFYFVFNKHMDNAHNSKYDVINLHLIIKKLYDDNILFFNNIEYNPEKSVPVSLNIFNQ